MRKITEDRELTSIQVSVETRELLRGLGRKGETYNDIITRLLKEREERHNG
ncbi:MAG: hypothetical protein WBZ42_03595 [Halobacteriota archaeon]